MLSCKNHINKTAANIRLKIFNFVYYIKIRIWEHLQQIQDLV